MLNERTTNVALKPLLIKLPKFLDQRGNLSFVEEQEHVPFKIKRVYWIYDVPGGQLRGGHAFKKTQELIIALSGSFDVVLNDGEKEYKYSLNRSYSGVFVPQMMWRSLENFSTNSLAVIIASTNYEVDDYIRDFKVFKKLTLC
ncbi:MULTISPECIES: sugar 3,4-ketoisomerase [unclassified Carboxylicivirga]|uniref:sugar 3,4-ketoisomerase n=1 Tax=Carboxylicivirga TaxID=1628153 RepID=UPI003D343CA7